jgi:hypothetical protein
MVQGGFLELVAELGVYHVIYVLQASRIQVTGSWRLPPRFQRKAWEFRQLVGVPASSPCEDDA